MENKSESFLDTVSNYSFKLALCEISIGSFLHAFHIPFTGQFLSLNQIFILSLVSKKVKDENSQQRAPLYISQISALLKSLSPAGKKLGPMLSISMQGNLFSLPQYILGTHSFSIALGALCASLWAFIQPLLTGYILFGNTIVKAYDYYISKIQTMFATTETEVLQILFIPVLLKSIVAIGISLWAYQVSESRSSKIVDRLIEKANRTPNTKKINGKSKLALLYQDITRPLFLISIVLTSVYIFFNRDVLAPTIWTYMRPIAVCILLIQLNRSSFVVKIIERNQEKMFFKILKNVNSKITLVQNQL